MSKERIQIKCPAKPITHAFLQFTDSEARDRYIRSANLQKRQLKEKKSEHHLSWMQRLDYSTKKKLTHQILSE